MEIENTNYVSYLANLAKGGRKRPFLDLCGINLTNVYTVTYRLLADSESAKRISAYTFLKAWENIDDYNLHNSFASWIRNLAIRFSIEEIRRSPDQKKQRPSVSPRSDLDYLQYLVSSLPSEDRIIFVLHDLEGFSYPEIRKFYKGLIEDEIKTKLINTREDLMTKMNI